MLPPTYTTDYTYVYNELINTYYTYAYMKNLIVLRTRGKSSQYDPVCQSSLDVIEN